MISIRIKKEGGFVDRLLFLVQDSNPSQLIPDPE
jgi:hypothetical protein